MSEAIITFKNVSKTYILYKNDQARFKALFFKPRPTKRSTTFPLKSTAANPSVSLEITVPVNRPCSR